MMVELLISLKKKKKKRLKNKFDLSKFQVLGKKKLPFKIKCSHTELLHISEPQILFPFCFPIGMFRLIL